MKPWMKILMWFGLGVSLGYCAGKQIGYQKAKVEDEQLVNNAYERGKHDLFKDTVREFNNIASQYQATPISSETTELPRFHVKEPDPYSEDDAEMPMDPLPPIDDDDILPMEKNVIRQLHQTHLIPRIVTEEEYDQHGDLDEKILIYYEGDEVLYCVEDQRVIGDDEIPCLIGEGTLMEFRVGPEVKDEIFVINETYGRFKVYRMDEAFSDAVDGNFGPEDDDSDEED